MYVSSHVISSRMESRISYCLPVHSQCDDEIYIIQSGFPRVHLPCRPTVYDDFRHYAKKMRVYQRYGIMVEH